MSGYDFDLIVLGAGSGGVRAGRIAAGHGARVAVVEEDRPGGTCVLRGCVPKKLLVYGSSFSAEFEDARGFGWQGLEPIHERGHDWGQLQAAKARELTRLAEIYRRLLDEAGAVLLEGRGRLVGVHGVEVAGTTYSAERILLAVGGWPSVPDIAGLRENAITSNEALALPHCPKRVVVLGSGYIAVEFAGIFNGFGAETHLVYRAELPLRGFDVDLRRGFAEASAGRGVHLHAETVIESVEARDGAKHVALSSGERLVVDEVLAATGRKPLTADLGLERVGVACDSGGAIMVDAESRTNIESIYAIGDVTGRVSLTPVALAEGHAFADRVYGGRQRRVDYGAVASAVFSQPPLACVGLSEDAAVASGVDVEIFSSSFKAMKNTLSGRDERSVMKLVVDKASDRVLGAHMLGADAPEIMQGLAIAIKAGAKKADFDATIGIHPTAAEEFVTMK